MMELGAENGAENAAERWDRHIPHYELTDALLPRAGAPWSELVHFAGSFDGYVIHPSQQLLTGFAVGSRERFLQDGQLPQGLTMLRTALHAEQRYDYWHRDEEPDPGADAMRHIHALVEAIRACVAAGAHMSPDASTVAGVQDKVMNAFDRLLVGYAAWGGYRHHGWTSYEDPRSFHGPVVWSERDCDLRFAFELEREWPRAVHMEFAISKSSRSDYDKATEGFQRVDVAVSDLSAFVEDDETFDRFRSHTQEAFFEVKWFVRGWGNNRDAKSRLADIPVDVAKLANHVRLGRCAVAGMLTVDDESYFQKNGSNEDWPAGVWRLYAGPSALDRRKLLAPEFR